MSTHENAEETEGRPEDPFDAVIAENVRKATAEQESKTLAQAEAVPDVPKIEHPKGRLLAVDGHSLAFRAFFALPEENFTAGDGQCTNSVYGFITMLADVVKKERPTHIGVAFDVKGGTFRDAMLPGYKGTRSAAPPELLSQIPLIQELLGALNIPCIERPGYEGDDVIASLAAYGERNGYATLVLSGDRDSFQLVDDNVTVLYPGRHFSDLKRMTPQAVLEKYKVTPRQYPDIAALRGEQSDNIPGVPGVGDGFAAKWINQYGGLDAIIAHADEIGGKKGQALRDHLDQVVLNRRVNAVVRDLDCGVDFDDLEINAFDQHALDAVLRRLRFGARTRTNLVRTFSANSGQEVGAAVLVGSDATGAAGTPAAVAAGPAAASSRAGQTSRVSAGGAAADIFGAARALDGVVPAEVVDPVDDGIVGSGTFGNAAGCAAADALASSVADWGATHLDDKAGCIALFDGDAHPGAACCAGLGLLAPDGHALLIEADVLSGSAKARAAVQTILDTHALTTHGYKQAIQLAKAAGLRFPRPAFDVQLAAYLTDPDFTAGTIEKTGTHFLDRDFESEAEADPAKKAPTARQEGFDFEDDAAPLETGQGRADRRTALLRRMAIVSALETSLKSALEQRGQLPLLDDVEIPSSAVLAGMEETGAAVDQMRMKDVHDDFAAQAAQAEAIALEAAGPGHGDLNLQSPKQLQQVLFAEMGLTGTKKTRTGYSTNAAELQKLYLRTVDDERANRFLGALLRYREVNKLKQIVESLQSSVNARDGRIHTTYEQTVAATGRLSSADPNLQNIPNRSGEGREIRSAFVAGAGFSSFLSSDYSQVELRLMAHLSGDEALIEAFRSDADFHRYVASLVYQIPVEEVTGQQRTRVKAMSYGLAYGLSTYGLAQRLNVSPAEADVLKEKYFATFGKVHDYLESLVSQARRRGYTETMFGRRRYFPALQAKNRVARAAAERAALNAPIQGSAADIMKMAMVKAAQDLAEAKLESRIILQIHDELVVELAAGEEEQATAIVRDAMENVVHLDVPLTVSTGVGPDWQSAAH